MKQDYIVTTEYLLVQQQTGIKVKAIVKFQILKKIILLISVNETKTPPSKQGYGRIFSELKFRVM